MSAADPSAGAPDEPLHPRPLLARDGWTDLSGVWRFRYDDDGEGLAGHWQDGLPDARDIVVPYPPESPLSGIGDTRARPVLWYQRTLPARLPADGHRLRLHFGAVDYRATVWVNGRHLGDHEGGHTPFAFDVTDTLHRDGTQNLLTVRAEDPATDLTQPRGKQDWRDEPHAIWYHRTSGIWQPVWLEEVPELHVDRLSWTPDLVSGSVRLEARLSRRPAAPCRLQVVLSLGERIVADRTLVVDDDAVDETIALPFARPGQEQDAVSWSPERPVLVDAVVRVVDGAAVDTVRSYLGLRSVGTGDGRFLLNGKPYFLRMVLGQGYWPESHLAAPDAGALRREVELIKELGFNGVRVHQKVEDPRFLYWCDRLGLVVWDEMPSAYAFSAQAVERVVREWTEVVQRDRSHPCVIAWVPLNESWGVEQLAVDAQRRHHAALLYHLTKALDPTRPVVGNDGWEHAVTDIVGVHDYGPDGEDLRRRYEDADAARHQLLGGRPTRRRVLLDPAAGAEQPIVISEFGGLSYRPAADDLWYGYSAVTGADDLLTRFTALIDALLASPVLAGFCYTQLTDVLQEPNGLLDPARTPKLPPAEVARVLRQPARSHPFERVQAERAAARQIGGPRP